MLLLFKTNDCLRHAERQLHSGADSHLITLKFCLRALLAPPPAAAVVRLDPHATLAAIARRTYDRLRHQLYRLKLRVA